MTSAAKTVAQGFMTGFVDVVSAMLSATCTFEVQSVSDASGVDLRKTLEPFRAAIESPSKQGGGFAFVFSGGLANRIVGGVLGEAVAEGDSIEGHDPATLAEVFGPCMGGGVSHFKEKYGKVIELQAARVGPAGEAAIERIRGLTGATARMASVVVRGVGDEGRGILLFSRGFEDIIPVEQGAAPTAQSGGEQAVAGEMEPEALDQLLQDLQPDAESEPVAGSRRPRASAAGGGGEVAPKNLDMVLDIQLVATARLGKVEMPIGDILTLGPGSIIEVGHLVDEPVELLVNNKLIARGDVVVVDEKFGLRITEIVSPKERIESLR